MASGSGRQHRGGGGRGRAGAAAAGYAGAVSREDPMTMRTGLLAAVLLVAAPALAAQPPDEADLPPDTDEAIAAPAVDDAAMPPAALAGDPLALPAQDAPPAMEWLRAARAETVVCPFRGRIDYRPGEIECGLIQVPENREVAGSRSIELHFVRIVAKGRDADGNPVEKRADPVVYLTGGPGAPATYYVQRFKDHRLVERRDLYILEQRGIGSSSPFCRFYGARNRADKVREDFAEQQRVELEQARACADQARAQGIDLRGYNTIENARDVRALRLALGLPDWNVWGISYGSVLGQALARVDREGIRAMVIDAIVPIDIGDLMRIGRWYARDLDKLDEACAAQPACAAAYPDQRRRYEAAIAAVLERPVVLEVQPSETWPGGRAVIHADLVAGMPFSLLYEEKTHAALPAIIEGLIAAVEQRDPVVFRALALAGELGGAGGDEYGAGMSMAIRCQDGYMDAVARQVAEEHAEQPVLARAFINAEVAAQAPALCAAAGVPLRGGPDYEPLRTDLPIVVANGAWDPVTPPPLARYVADRLGNARYVEFPHAGHGPTRSLECGGEFLNAFFDDPAAPLRMDCVEEGGEAATYFAPYWPTQAFARGIVHAAEQPRKALLPHLAWGGLGFGLSLLGLLVLLVAWLGRRLDRAPRPPGSLPRWITGLAALAAVGHGAGIGVAAAMAARATPAMLVFGLPGWARWAAWAAPAAGALGLLALVVVLAGRQGRAGKLACALVALAAVAASAFSWWWGLWPV